MINELSGTGSGGGGFADIRDLPSPPIKLSSVVFFGDAILAFTEDGQIYCIVKPIVEGEKIAIEYQGRIGE